MLAKADHLFDEATRVSPGDSCWTGKTSEDYWAFVGPWGGFSLATMLRAIMEHPLRAGDPLSITVNFCAPVAEGLFDLDVRLIKANRSTQHWCVEMSQNGADVATLATAVFAERRPSWSHLQTEFPKATPFDQTIPHGIKAGAWVKQYDFRFVEGEPKYGGLPTGTAPITFSKFWVGDRIPRKIDMLSLMAMSDSFFARIFHARREIVPFGTVSLTTYLHVTAEELAAEDITHMLATVDANIFNRSFSDQSGELWSPSGRLLATSTQVAYFKA